MTEEPKTRKPRQPRRGAAIESVNFADHMELLAFVKERAAANMRTVGQEILFRLQVAKKQFNQRGFQKKVQA